MEGRRRVKIDLGDGTNLSAAWHRMSALEIYNCLLAGSYQSEEWSTTERRMWALDIFKKRFTLRLPDLVDEFREIWPHWRCCTAATLDVDSCCRRINEFFRHLETGGKPFSLDAWRPTTRRSRNTAADSDRIVRRFLDNGFCKPKSTGRRRRLLKMRGNCRVHADRQAYYDGMCPTCYQRYNRLKAADVLRSDTPPAAIEAVLRLPAVRGRSSTLFEDARRTVANYAD